MHLYNMRWLTRCWTLAEALSAWKMEVAIGGVAKNIAKLICDIRENAADDFNKGDGGNVQHVSPQASKLVSAIVARFSCPFEVFVNSKDGFQDLRATWSSLLHRSTKKSSDIPGILAVANAISPKEVVRHIDVQDRMKSVLNVFRQFPAEFLFHEGPKLNEPLNRWVPSGPPQLEKQTGEQKDILGLRRREFLKMTSEMLDTYDEGKMVGPLRASTFPSYIFTGPPPMKFQLKISQPGDTAEHILHVELKEDIQHRDHDRDNWCIVLSSLVSIDGFIHPSTCTAFCAAVERESSTPSKFLVTWETLADVRLSGGQQLDPTTQVLRATKLSENKIFISCDMTHWPSPLALRHTFSVQQERKIFRHRGRFITIIYIALALMWIVCVLAILDSAYPVPGLATMFISACCLLSSARSTLKINRNSLPTTEAGNRSHKDWRELFLPSRCSPEKLLFARYLIFLRWVHRGIRFPLFERSIFTFELFLCTVGAFLSAYLAVANRERYWFAAPAIVAWTTLAAIPLLWSHCSMYKHTSIYLPSCCGMVGALGSSFTLAPVFAYDLPPVTNIACYILFGISSLHILLIFVLWAKFVSSMIIDQRLKNPATLEMLFVVNDNDNWFIKVVWKPFLSALQHSPYYSLTRRRQKKLHGLA